MIGFGSLDWVYKSNGERKSEEREINKMECGGSSNTTQTFDQSDQDNLIKSWLNYFINNLTKSWMIKSNDIHSSHGGCWHAVQ